ncbi:hypothetical protein BpHYR1_022448 [Brachionus plicatilis]|uniref:Uncharacterized protein n=1 Tax=Brachionus plicatilis TaxID=10195 RepID=A0A3M7S3I3_BRAPC|nr:hypothetical protein BpHYR1_022448 [Brachionus plicatilis]
MNRVQMKRHNDFFNNLTNLRADTEIFVKFRCIKNLFKILMYNLNSLISVIFEVKYADCISRFTESSKESKNDRYKTKISTFDVLRHSKAKRPLVKIEINEKLDH